MTGHGFNGHADFRLGAGRIRAYSGVMWNRPFGRNWLSLSLLTLVAVSPWAGCLGESDPGKVCTTQFVYGLTLKVVDASTGVAVTGAIVTATGSADGASETFESGLEEGTYFGLGEKTGDYEVTVSKEGFVSQSFAIELVLDEDGCHVVPQTREITLAAAG